MLPVDSLRALAVARVGVVGPTRRNETVAPDDQVQSSTAVEVKPGRDFPHFKEGSSLTVALEARLFSPAEPTGSPGGRQVISNRDRRPKEKDLDGSAKSFL